MSKEKQNFIDRLVGKGTLQQRIMKTILICVLLPMAILSVVSILQVAPLTTDIGTQGTNAVSQEGIDALQSSATDAARWVRIELDQAKADLKRLVDVGLSIFNNTMNITETRPSYNANGTPSLSTTTSSKYGNLGVNLNYTDWGNALTLNVTMRDKINKSAYLDYSLKGIVNNSAYMTITQVYKDGITRVYPYIASSRTSTEDLRLQSWYLATISSARGVMVVGSSHVKVYGSVTYPALYLSMPLKYANGTTIGAVAIEYRLSALRAHLNSIDIQSTGHVAMMNSSRIAFSHKGLSESTVSSAMTTLEGLSTAEFTSLLTIAVGGTNSTGAFTKSGMEMRAAYATVGAGNLYIIAFVPYSEIISPSMQLQSDLANLNMVAILIFMGAAVAIFIVVYFIVIKVSRSITRPVVTLTAAIENMTKGDLTSEIPMDAKSRGDELGTLAMSFQNLLTTMRLGNKSYYRGDLTLAYTNYKAALELFETTGNLRGQAMSHNNLGNIYRQWADIDKAKEAYEKSIKIGESQTDHAGLAARYNNRGLLLLSEENYDAAKADFDRALQIDKELGDEKGIATRNRNIGILNILRQQWKTAQKFLEEALKIDSDLGNDAGVAEDEFQIGRLAYATNDTDGADQHFKKALKVAQGLQNYPLMKNILGQMVKLYDSMDATTALHKAEAELTQVNQVLMKPKEVVFVMDQSGSMQAEGKMTASRSGALEVFEETINIGDEVAVIGFHSIINPLLPLTRKKGTDIAKIKGSLMNLDSTPYQTAFYDAVAYAIEMLKTTPPEEQRWIVALTDGQDNMSKQYNPASLAKLIRSISPPLNFVLIGVGSELKMVHNEMTQIVEATPRGKYIKIYSAKNVKKAIEEAFQKVKEIMASSEIEGFTPE